MTEPLRKPGRPRKHLKIKTPEAVQLVTQKLKTGITHPGHPEKNQPPLQMITPFRTTGMPPQLAKQIDASTELMAEGIIHAIEQQFELTPKNQPKK